MASEIPRLATDPPERVFPVVWKLLCFLKLPSLDGSPSLPLLCLFLSFILCPTSFLSGCLMSSISIQKMFCGISSVFKCTFDEFVGEKVVSPSYFSTILGLPPVSDLKLKKKKPSDYFLTVLEMLGGRVQTFLKFLIHNVSL